VTFPIVLPHRENPKTQTLLLLARLGTIPFKTVSELDDDEDEGRKPTWPKNVLSSSPAFEGSLP